MFQESLKTEPEPAAGASPTPAMEAGRFFAERRARADREAFLRILNRKGGEPPRPEDTLD